MNTPHKPPSDHPGTPLGAHMRRQILVHLMAASELARHDLDENLDAFRDHVVAVLERVDGALLPQTVAAQSTAQPVSQLKCVALAPRADAPADEFLLIPFGEVVVERPIAGESFAFTREHAESARRWFEQMGRKLAIDYEHQSFDRLNTRPDGLRPAAGWIGGLDVREDGLWAIDVEWTQRATTLLRAGEYRYFSPVIFWSDEDRNDVAALGPVALTNDPAMHGVKSLSASRTPEHRTTKESASATDRALADAESEVATLRRQLVEQQADAFIERGMRIGKIIDSTSMDWRDDYLRDADATEARLSRAPVLLPPGRMTLAIDRSTSSTPPQQRGPNDIDAEDLAAFENALAAGRVRGL